MPKSPLNTQDATPSKLLISASSSIRSTKPLSLRKWFGAAKYEDRASQQPVSLAWHKEWREGERASLAL